ncbi:MAG: hypothetical protein IMF09_03290 [Proteobacteria bacterium]|nr:hypothetical protein [Pseudomonadota bacterium]
MNIYTHKKMRGATLIDALIAMAVGGVGLLALAIFQADLLTTSSDSRTRSEAAHLAQQKMEQLRDLAVKTDIIKTSASLYVAGDKVFNQSSIYSGQNATFTIASVISGHAVGSAYTTADTQYLTAKITVSWTDSDNSQESVFVASLIAWDNPVAAAARGDITDLSQLITVGAVPPPSGGGRMADDGDTLFAGAGINNNDGTFIYIENGVYQIAALKLGDAEYSPVFVSTEPLLKISGNISTNGDPADLTILRVLTSDFGFCIYREDGDTFSGSNGLEYTAVSSTDIPINGDFNCYIAASWHGNLGVLNKTGENFCSAAIRYMDNCDILDSVLYLDFTNSGTCPYSGSPVNGLIGVLVDQNFSINNGGCEIAESNVAQPSVVGEVGDFGTVKTTNVIFSDDGGVTFSDCTTTISGGSVTSFKCVTTADTDIIIKLIFSRSPFSCTFEQSVGDDEIIRNVADTSCNET